MFGVAKPVSHNNNIEPANTPGKIDKQLRTIAAIENVASTKQITITATQTNR